MNTMNWKNTQIKDAGAVFQAYFNLSSIMKYNQKWFIKKVNGLEISRKVLGIRQPESFKIILETYNDNLKKFKYKSWYAISFRFKA